MNILFLLKKPGVEKHTVFIEVVKALIERGAKIHIVIASMSKQYMTEKYYDEEPNVSIDILDITDSEIAKAAERLKTPFKKCPVLKKIIWTVLNFFIQWIFRIRNKSSRREQDYIFKKFLSSSMRSFVLENQYDYIWTVDEYSLLWAEWINRHSEKKNKLVHHSFELYWEHYSLPQHKHWQYFTQYALFEQARIILQKAAIIIIQDETRWDILCQYTGIARKRKKYLLPVSIRDYPVNKTGSTFEKIGVKNYKNIILYSSLITPIRGCMELVGIAQNLDSRFSVVIHGYMADSDYLQALRKKVIFPDKTIISNTTLSYQELVDLHNDVWCVFLYYSEDDNNNKYIVNASNKLVMALQAGKPIITTGNSALAELCLSYECGISINGWTETEFIDAVHKLEQNYNLYCKNARKCYEECFNIELYMDKIYQGLLSKI